MFAILPLTLLVACGDDGGGSSIDAKPIDAKLIDAPTDGLVVDAPIDGPPMIDAMQTVVEVTCPNNPDAEITTAGFSYSPQSVTISQNGIVRFVMIDGTNHNVVPLTTMTTDPGLQVGYGETKCLQFTATGTFYFKCMPHSFSGSVVVQ
jgi:plastocyanin